MKIENLEKAAAKNYEGQVTENKQCNAKEHQKVLKVDNKQQHIIEKNILLHEEVFEQNLKNTKTCKRQLE